MILFDHANDGVRPSGRTDSCSAAPDFPGDLPQGTHRAAMGSADSGEREIISEPTPRDLRSWTQCDRSESADRRRDPTHQVRWARATDTDMHDRKTWAECP